MNNDVYQENLQQAQARILKRDRVILFLSLLLLISSMSVYRLIGAERVVVSPPTLSKSFWVSGEKGDNSYLEQMGGFVAWLVLDLTPASAEWKKNAVLTYADPALYGDLKIRLEVEANRLRRLNGATFFHVQQLQPDEDTQTVTLTGLLHTTVNGQETAPAQCRYEVGFQFKGGRAHLSKFKEIVNENHGFSVCGGTGGR